MNRMIKIMVVGIAFFIASNVSWAGSKEFARVDNSIEVLRSINQIPEEGIPSSLLAGSEGIAVIPGVIKAGFVVGGRHGKGILSIKNENNTWSQPTFISLSGGSFGFQAGVQSADIILVFKTRRSINGIMDGKFTLGGDAAISAGPVGRNASAATDLELRAEIYSYSRSRGLFAGIALDGSVINIDYDSNTAVYGENGTPRKIFSGDVKNNNSSIVELIDLLEEMSAQSE
ncbi:MAG: lipid-binding SYLF domain-containing protein [bacterium]